MLVSGLVLGLIGGFLAGGDIRNFRRVELRGLPLVLIAIVARFAVPLAPQPIFFASLALVGVAALWNRNLPGAWLIALGAFMNALVVAANGAMPVDGLAAAQVGSQGAHDQAHVVLGPETRLAFLADIIPLVRSVYSPGDVVSAIGGFWLVLRTMRP